jgi:hypothetical protein
MKDFLNLIPIPALKLIRDETDPQEGSIGAGL